MKIFLLASCAALFSACFSPSYSDPGFYCHATDNPACPDGQECVNGRCTSGGAVATSTIDMAHTQAITDAAAGGSAVDAAMKTNSSDDLSKREDLAKAEDLSKPHADLTMCVANGASCNYHNNTECCSGYCDYGNEKCAKNPN